MLCGKTNDNSKDNKLLLLIVIITGFLHIKIYKKFKQDRFWIFVVFVGIMFVLGYKILTYDEDKVYVKWDDDTVGMIINQELVDIYHSYYKTPINKLPDIRELNLDAELITSIKVLKYLKNLEKLVINAKNIKSLKTLQSLEKLDELVIIHGDMNTLKYLKKLNASNLVLENFNLLSVEPLLEMPNLSKLEIKDSYINDTQALSKLENLTYLSLINVQADSPISLCENGNYEGLYLSNIDIDNFDFLPICKNLTSLKLEKINIENGMDIELPTRLTEVMFKGCGLKNLKQFLTLPNLVSLDVSDNEILDINDLFKFNNLKELSLANNSIHDLKPIKNLKGHIKLNISGIKLDKNILRLLSKMQFEELYVANCDLSDLDFLEGHKEIKRLDISNNSIRDIGILKMYRKELAYLNIAWNPIDDLTPLAEWAPYTLLNDKRNAEFPGVEFDITGIQLEEIEEDKGIRILKEMLFHKLTAKNCGLKNASLVRYQLKIEYLDISNNPIEDIAGTDNLKFLKEMVAKNTLIDGDKIIIFGVLSPSKVYTISSYWKWDGSKSSFYGREGKAVMTRVILK